MAGAVATLEGKVPPELPLGVRRGVADWVTVMRGDGEEEGVNVPPPPTPLPPAVLVGGAERVGGARVPDTVTVPSTALSVVAGVGVPEPREDTLAEAVAVPTPTEAENPGEKVREVRGVRVGEDRGDRDTLPLGLVEAVEKREVEAEAVGCVEEVKVAANTPEGEAAMEVVGRSGEAVPPPSVVTVGAPLEDRDMVAVSPWGGREREGRLVELPPPPLPPPEEGELEREGEIEGVCVPAATPPPPRVFVASVEKEGVGEPVSLPELLRVPKSET